MYLKHMEEQIFGKILCQAEKALRDKLADGIIDKPKTVTVSLCNFKAIINLDKALGCLLFRIMANPEKLNTR